MRVIEPWRPRPFHIVSRELVLRGTIATNFELILFHYETLPHEIIRKDFFYTDNFEYAMALARFVPAMVKRSSMMMYMFSVSTQNPTSPPSMRLFPNGAGR